MTVVDDYVAGRSLRAISLATGRHRDGLKAELARAGVPLRGAMVQRRLNTLATDVPIGGDLAELVDGLMLGDGGIEYRPGRAPRLNMTNAHRDYVDYVADLLRSHGVDPYIGVCGRGHWRVLSLAWPALESVIPRWYIGTRKRAVPMDLQLTPIAIRHWWLGDGGLAKHKGKRPTGYLYTNSFPEVDVRRLANDLTAMGMSATANRCGGPQNHEWRIHLSGSGVRALLAAIGPCPVPSYAYKWNAQEVYRDWSPASVAPPGRAHGQSSRTGTSRPEHPGACAPAASRR